MIRHPKRGLGVLLVDVVPRPVRGRRAVGVEGRAPVDRGAGLELEQSLDLLRHGPGSAIHIKR